MTTLSEQIRRARERRGWTQADLARRIGVARETVGNWETGVSTPRNALGRLQDVLGEQIGGKTREGGPDEAGERRAGEIVGGGDQTGLVLLDLPPKALDGLTDLEREEVLSAARTTLLERARQIRDQVGHEREQ